MWGEVEEQQREASIIYNHPMAYVPTSAQEGLVHSGKTIKQWRTRGRVGGKGK